MNVQANASAVDRNSIQSATTLNGTKFRSTLPAWANAISQCPMRAGQFPKVAWQNSLCTTAMRSGALATNGCSATGVSNVLPRSDGNRSPAPLLGFGENTPNGLGVADMATLTISLGPITHTRFHYTPWLMSSVIRVNPCLHGKSHHDFKVLAARQLRFTPEA